MVFRKAFAILMIVIFGLVSLPTFFVRSIATTYINPSFYEGAVLDESYDYFVGFISGELYKDQKVATYYSEEEIEVFINKYFPKESVKSIVQDFVLQLKSLSDKRMDGAITVSLMPLKQNIKDMAGEITDKIIGGIPVCDAEQELSAIVYENDLPVCLPQQVDKNEIIKPVVKEIEYNLNEAIPSEFKLDARSNEDLQEVHLTQIISVIGYIEMILPLFMIIVLLIIMLVIYKPISLVIKYVGSALILGGLISIIAAQLILRLPEIAIKAQVGGDLTAAELGRLQNFYTFMFEFITDKMTIYSLYFICIGLVSILVSLFLLKRHNPPSYSE